MNFQGSIIEKDEQEKLINVIHNKHCVFQNGFSKMFILAQKKSNHNNNINIINLTDYYLKYGHSTIEDMNDSEYTYLNKIVVFNNDIININNKQYKIEVATYQTNSFNKMILKDLSNNEFVKIDLNNNKNINNLYSILSLKKKNKNLIKANF